VTKQGHARPGEPSGGETEQVRTALVSGAHRPPHKGADDGDGLGGIGARARGGDDGCVRKRGDLWEANLRRKGRGGRIGALGRVTGEGAPGHGWSAAQGIGSSGGGEGGERLVRTGSRTRRGRREKKIRLTK
jgi:hypothetical protein